MFRQRRIIPVVCLAVSLLCTATAHSSVISSSLLKGQIEREDVISQTARVRPSERQLYALWNGFLDQTNILELGNIQSFDITVRIDLFRLDGSLGTSLLVPIPEKQQRDIIVNELTGFSPNSYGVIRLSFYVGNIVGDSSLNLEEDQDRSDIVDARMSFYKAGKDGSYDFAFSLPLLPPDTYGRESIVAFNTFQPSSDVTDARNVVANWLTIVNLNSHTTKFKIDSFRVDGTPLPARTVEVPAFGRVDVEAGHENPGPSNVGLHIVRPIIETADEDEHRGGQLVQLTRYGYRSDGSIGFAFPLQAISDSNDYSSFTTSDGVLVPLSTMLTAQNWLELANAESTSSSLDLQMFDADGALKHSQKVVLGPHAQNHINVNQYLGESRTGHAVLKNIAGPGGVANDEDENYRKPRIVAQSMHYFRNSKGGIDTIYGAEALPLSDYYLWTSGSYNLFLGMNNWLKIFNRASFSGKYRVVVHRFGAADTSQTVTVPANGSIDVPIHSNALFATQANTYGVVDVFPMGLVDDQGREVFENYEFSAQVLRVRMKGTNTVDFIAPTPVSSTEGQEF